MGKPFEQPSDRDGIENVDLKAALEQGKLGERIWQPTQAADGSTIVRNFYTYPLLSGDTVRGAVAIEKGQFEEGLKFCQQALKLDPKFFPARFNICEIPFQQGKNALVEKIAEAAKEKRIEGVSDIRDESSREGVRIVIDLRRDATPEVVLNQIWRNTPAQSSFPANMLAIRGGRPELLNLRDIIEAFVKFREEVITRRTKFELNKARDRAHILLGLVVAVTNLDEVVKIIRGSASPAEARETLLANADKARISRELVRLKSDIPVKDDLESFRVKPQDQEKLVAAMSGLQVGTPFGQVTYRPLDHQSTMGTFVGQLGVKDGKGYMKEWRFVDGKDALPTDDEVKKMRPAQ